MDPNWATIIVAALGGSSVIGYAIKEIVGWRTGAAARDRARNRSLMDRLELAEARLDWEASARRITQEFAAKERRKLLENGIELEDWPCLSKILGPRP